MLYRKKYLFTTNKWFFLTALFSLCFLLYTGVLATGVLLYPTLHLEQLLLTRPLTGADCVLRGWSRLGQADVSALLTLALGIVCLMLGYRKRVLPYVILLLVLGVGVEVLGKQVLPQPVPDAVHSGILSLQCPQMGREPRLVRLELTAGMWWKAPPIGPNHREMAQMGATAPLLIDDDAVILYDYPSGHAIRWAFLGLVACWILSRHIKRRSIRVPLMMLALLVAVGGGFSLFYIGYHLGTDVLGGYLLGASLACCAIGLLERNVGKLRVGLRAKSEAMLLTPCIPTDESGQDMASLVLLETHEGSSYE